MVAAVLNTAKTVGQFAGKAALNVAVGYAVFKVAEKLVDVTVEGYGWAKEKLASKPAEAKS